MKRAAFLFAGIFAFMAISGQERWQADLHIQAMKASCEGTDKVISKVVVKNYNDDDTRNVVLTILLPVEVSVVQLPANCQLVNKGSAANNNLTGCVQCTLGNMTVNQVVEVTLTTTKSKFTNKFGAFVYGETPDPVPANNYKEVIVTCK
jgi:hypothetical protein